MAESEPQDVVANASVEDVEEEKGEAVTEE
jgi:hypothetical protein